MAPKILHSLDFFFLNWTIFLWSPPVCFWLVCVVLGSPQKGYLMPFCESNIQFPEITLWLSSCKHPKSASVVNKMETHLSLWTSGPSPDTLRVCAHIVCFVGELADCVDFRRKGNGRVVYIETDGLNWEQSSRVSWKKKLKRHVTVRGTPRGRQHQHSAARLAADVTVTARFSRERGGLSSRRSPS